MSGQFSRIAIIKPDHVGDLILSLPNINFLATTAEHVHLFVSPMTIKIARQLLPNAEIFPIQFAHLSKSAMKSPAIDPTAFDAYDIVLVLRDDGVLSQRWCRSYHGCFFCVGNDNDHVHDTFGQADRIEKLFGPYDVRRYQLDGLQAYPSNVRRVGLSVGSGFTTNAWPWVNWLELGRKLQYRGVEVILIGGPDELNMLPTLAGLMALPPENILVGSSELGPFLRAVRELDVVVASDGGTGHLCSLGTSVISLQTSGKWRRFSPFGEVHRTLTRDLTCAPCLNFDPRGINLCASRECSYLLLPDHVIDALFRPQAVPGTTVELDTALGAKLTFGASHLGRSGANIRWW